MNYKSKNIKGPLKKEILALRIMIIIGLGSAVYFFHILLNPQNIGHPVFYWILMSTIFFGCLQTLHEWYHYFSISIPKTPESDKKYTVDVFTTFCAGEPYSMIIETLEAIQKISYPHTTYLGDESNDAFLISECKRLGVHHVTRNNRINAKAGNINNILSQSSGELCVVLDPDHVPTTDFLDYTTPHFADPEVGFVQVVQAYSNFRENLIAKGSAQQTFQFYGPMMMTMNSYGTVMAIGANCTFRRTALESIGGHAAGLAEDMHTAMQLHAKGWKSKYVPAVLSRGLVPTTLSAYYKQQLKWSRGVFELLVTSYPKLFSKFTWRQKLHYGSIPFHYFSGVIYFLNFLIPILSLVFDFIPFRIDILRFAVASLPLLISIILIRHYVQRWVTEEGERGFHVVGGLLLIGTWWIYILGFVFTLIRRKVPYDPTPKDGADPNNWGLNIPNIIVGVCSFAAIVYGLYIDYTPYTMVMASIAGLNCLFMAFVIIASRQSSLRSFKKKYPPVNATVKFMVPLKVLFYDWRHGLYSVFRKLAFPLVLVGATTSFFYSKNPPVIHSADEDKYLPSQKNIMLKGIFAPETTNGLSSIRKVLQFQNSSGTHLNIVSLYLPWGENAKSALPTKLLDSIYQNNSIPMLTWEPWGSLFTSTHDSLKNEKNICQKINSGIFDEYIFRSATALKDLKQPVFLRFAHEPDNPFYPWSPTGNNTPEDYRKAWKHVRAQFHKAGAFNIIWVWNPWKANAAEAYFPGVDQVDWLALTILNYGPYHEDKNWYSFQELLASFLKTKPFKNDLPVMIAEMGSLRAGGDQEKWFKDAFKYILRPKSRIKSIVFFNNKSDLNVPGNQASSIDWTLTYPSALPKLLKTEIRPDSLQYFTSVPLTIPSAAAADQPIQLQNCKGVNYTKGLFWFRNLHTLTKKEILADFTQMQNLGINTIKIYGPGVYDKNIITSAENKKLNIMYAFNIPKGIAFMEDTNYLTTLSKSIMSSVEDLKDVPVIISWNISSDALEDARRRFFKPASLYHRYAYVNWLKNLVAKIKKADPSRPVTIDISAYQGMAEDLQFLYNSIPSVSAFGIAVNSDTSDIGSLKSSSIPFFFSKISASKLKSYNDAFKTAFISDWQDTWSSNKVTFDGMIDHYGIRKNDYYETAALWSEKATAFNSSIPLFKIMKSSIPTKPGALLTYNVVIKNQGEWKLANEVKNLKLHFEWHLIQSDVNGKAKELINVGKGSELYLTIPDDPHLYQLYLTAYSENESKSEIKPLVLWPADTLK